jgi:hypothetical protein
MSTTEAPFSFTTKFMGDLLTVRGETVDQFAERLMDLTADPRISDALTSIQSMNGIATAITTFNATPIVAAPAQPVQQAPSATAGPEVVMDKFGGKWTYGLSDAPALPDGRGNYVLREWTDKNGKARKAFWDPSGGPKPFAPGTVEAKPIWK